MMSGRHHATIFGGGRSSTKTADSDFDRYLRPGMELDERLFMTSTFSRA